MERYYEECFLISIYDLQNFQAKMRVFKVLAFGLCLRNVRFDLLYDLGDFSRHFPICL